MYRQLFISIFLCAFLSSMPVNSTEFLGGINWGYYGGNAWDIYGTAHQFTKGFPISGRLNVGYATFDPGNANDARRIFINNNQGGTIQEKGSILRFSIDFLFPITILSLPESYIFAGPRYASFKGNFKFIGDNEDFDVTSKHWGVGLGFESWFAINSRFHFKFLGGLDYYGASSLYGHDTAYDPSGENSNPREDYQYTDADKAINQPGFEPRIMIGLSYRFGR